MNGQNSVTRSPEGLAAAADAVPKQGGLPPVQLWNPPYSGDLDMRIARDGTWYHEGGVIRRPAMVKLFSSILKLEYGKFFLVTPVEKVGISVEDAPFVAVDCDPTGEGAAQLLSFTTHVGDRVAAGPDNPIRVATSEGSGGASPYVMVRAGLEARIDRKTFYRIVDLGVHRDGWFGLWSGGAFFPLMASATLEA